MANWRHVILLVLMTKLTVIIAAKITKLTRSSYFSKALAPTTVSLHFLWFLEQEALSRGWEARKVSPLKKPEVASRKGVHHFQTLMTLRRHFEKDTRTAQPYPQFVDEQVKVRKLLTDRDSSNKTRLAIYCVIFSFLGLLHIMVVICFCALYWKRRSLLNSLRTEAVECSTISNVTAYASFPQGVFVIHPTGDLSLAYESSKDEI